MRVGIQNKGILDLSVVRGVGSYVTMLLEGLATFGKKYDLLLDQQTYDVLLHPGFFPYGQLDLNTESKNVVVVHDLIPLKYAEHYPAGIRGVWRWFQNRNKLRSCDGLITDTEVVKKEIVQKVGVPTNRIRVIYPAVKNIFYQQPKKIEYPPEFESLPPKFLLYVGDVTWNKNLVTLARAVQESNTTIVLVGKALVQRDSINHPWQRSFKEFVSLTQNDKRFIFLGYVPDELVMSLYRRAVATVLPSYDEGFGLPWLEAALCGAPVILSKIPVFEEITRGTSVYINQHDAHSCAQTLGELFFNKPPVLSQQTKQAKSFSQEAFIKGLSDYLHQL